MRNGVAVAMSAALLAASVQAKETEKPAMILDKTLVAWVYPANLTQRGGSVLTLDDTQGCFDGIVFGEIAPGKWMAGSDHLRRSQKDQAAGPAETAGSNTRVQVAVVYKGRQVVVYRDGKEYARYQIAEPQAFGPDSVAVLGLRHLEAADRACERSNSAALSSSLTKTERPVS